MAIETLKPAIETPNSAVGENIALSANKSSEKLNQVGSEINSEIILQQLVGEFILDDITGTEEIYLWYLKSTLEKIKK